MNKQENIFHLKMSTFYRYLYWVLHLMTLEKKCDNNKYVDFYVVYQTTYLIKNELPFKKPAARGTAYDFDA